MIIVTMDGTGILNSLVSSREALHLHSAYAFVAW